MATIIHQLTATDSPVRQALLTYHTGRAERTHSFLAGFVRGHMPSDFNLLQSGNRAQMASILKGTSGAFMMGW